MSDAKITTTTTIDPDIRAAAGMSLSAWSIIVALIAACAVGVWQARASYQTAAEAKEATIIVERTTNAALSQKADKADMDKQLDGKADEADMRILSQAIMQRLDDLAASQNELHEDVREIRRTQMIRDKGTR